MPLGKVCPSMPKELPKTVVKKSHFCPRWLGKRVRQGQGSNISHDTITNVSEVHTKVSLTSRNVFHRVADSSCHVHTLTTPTRGSYQLPICLTALESQRGLPVSFPSRIRPGCLSVTGKELLGFPCLKKSRSN